MKSIPPRFLNQVENKKCGLLIFLKGSPKPCQDGDRQPCNYRSSMALQAITLFPRKSHNLHFQNVRGCLPQSFHSPQSPSLTRFTLSYPSCSTALSFGNERANTHAIPTRLKQSSFLREPLQVELALAPKQSLTHRWFVQLPYIRSVQLDDNRSPVRSIWSTSTGRLKSCTSLKEERSRARRRLQACCRDAARRAIGRRAVR